VQQHYSAIKIIKNNNFGFAQGYNEALKHIDAEIY
jgi:GT2 family glycosyltransferase